MVPGRVRASHDVQIPDPDKRRYGEWSQTGYFYTDFSGRGAPDAPQAPHLGSLPPRSPPSETSPAQPPAPRIVWPRPGEIIDTPNPNFDAV